MNSCVWVCYTNHFECSTLAGEKKKKKAQQFLHYIIQALLTHSQSSLSRM